MSGVFTSYEIETHLCGNPRCSGRLSKGWFWMCRCCTEVRLALMEGHDYTLTYRQPSRGQIATQLPNPALFHTPVSLGPVGLGSIKNSTVKVLTLMCPFSFFRPFSSQKKNVSCSLLAYCMPSRRYESPGVSRAVASSQKQPSPQGADVIAVSLCCLVKDWEALFVPRHFEQATYSIWP